MKLRSKVSKGLLKKLVSIACTGVIAMSVSAINLQNLYAHGWVVNDRAWLGGADGGRLNTNMGGVVNEPQSVGELNLRFGVERGLVSLNEAITANAGSVGGFDAMRQYGIDRWHRTQMIGGPNDMVWHFTAPHRTHSFVYYITRDGWNPNAPLDYADFEHLATFDGFGLQPPRDLTHTINLPTDRSGVHTILIAWHVSDNNVSWYRVKDIYLINEGSPASPFPTPAPTPAPEQPGQAPAWNVNNVYFADDMVTHNGSTWVAMWWTQGDEPGTTGQWGVWQLVSSAPAPQPTPIPTPQPTPVPTPQPTPVPGQAPTWDVTTIYVENDVVTHNGITWVAMWWTQGDEPGTTEQWGVWRPLN